MGSYAGLEEKHNGLHLLDSTCRMTAPGTSRQRGIVSLEE
jgi:hypothetical protein